MQGPAHTSAVNAGRYRGGDHVGRCGIWDGVHACPSQYNPGVSFPYHASSLNPSTCNVLRLQERRVNAWTCRRAKVSSDHRSLLSSQNNVASLWKHELPTFQPLAPSRPSQRGSPSVPAGSPRAYDWRPSALTIQPSTWARTPTGNPRQSPSDDDESDLDDDWHQFRGRVDRL